MEAIRKISARCIGDLAAATCAIAISITGSAFAVTPQELAGDYTLTALDINYGGSFPPPLDESDFSTVTGYFSATAAALVFEHFGQDNINNTVYQNVVAGTYQLSGNTATVARSSGSTLDVQISMPNQNTVVVTGVSLDSNNQQYIYGYRYSRDETYYTQDALDDAVADALANVDPVRVPVVIPLFD